MAGISHLLCDAKAGRPSFDGWNLVQETEDFFLLENPLYRGRYFVRTQGEKNHFSPVVPDWRTNNKIHVTVPPGTKELSVLESYSKGWSARTGKGEELPLSSTERYSILVSVPDSEQQTEILLPYQTHSCSGASISGRKRRDRGPSLRLFGFHEIAVRAG